MQELLLGVIWYVVLVFSLTFHEAAHAWAALRGGDPTAYHGGQVSLDPTPHIRREPFGTVLVPLFSYAMAGWMIGWASTPYDPRWAWAHPRRAAWMALAGPAANLLLVVAAALLIRVGLSADVFHAPRTIRMSDLVGADPGSLFATAGTLLSILFSLNLLLFLFNLIPLPPLDGSGALALLVSDDAARKLQQLLSQPQLSLIGLLVAWYLIGPVFRKLHLLAVNLLYPGVSYG